MPCRGVHFGLTSQEDQRLLAAANDAAVVEILQEEVEERWNEEWLYETDKAWDAIHRCLVRGSLTTDGSILSKAILGGRQLYRGSDRFVSYLTQNEVRVVAKELAAVDECWMRERYAMLQQHDYDGPANDDDFAYTWEHLQGLREFLHRAAAAERPVVFCVDQ